MSEALPPTRTQGTMFRGRVSLEQHRDGYRFSVDAVLLAHFAAQHKPRSTLDLGAGCGVVPLLLADLWSFHLAQQPQMWGLECQASLEALARANVAANQRSEQIQIVGADARRWSWPDKAQELPRLITCNPPYFRVGAGRISPRAERANARHEHNGTVEELVAAAARLLHPRGHLAMIYPADGCERLMAALLAARLHTTRIQCVHPHRDDNASLILFMARHRASPLTISPPLILYHHGEERQPTDELDAILKGEL